MRRSELFALFLVALLFFGGLALFQHAPGYMDADYYYAGGLRLARGYGFSDAYLWNYLDDPGGLPHPSHGYWFPLASMVAALGMVVSGQQQFVYAQLGFILIAALVAPVTALLGYQVTSRRDLGLSAGLLIIFCGYYAVYMPATDNYGIFMLLGGLFFLLLDTKINYKFLWGVIAGLLNLSRSDGILWLILGCVFLVASGFFQKDKQKPGSWLFQLLFFFGGYILVMGPWMMRNMQIWGSPMGPAGQKVLWMNGYDDTFAWPAERINFGNWMAAGWESALSARLQSFKLNAFNTFAAQASFVLLPFILAGIYFLRNDRRIRFAVAGWLVLFFVMTFIFPFAGARGSFFHAGAALLPVWIISVVVGVDQLVTSARQRGMFSPAAPRFFFGVLLLSMGFLTVYLANIAIYQNDWGKFWRKYQQVEFILKENTAQPDDLIIVSNPPGYYAVTGRSSIMLPNEDLDTMLDLAKKFGARFVAIDREYYPDPLIQVYDDPYHQPGLIFTGEIDGIRVFKIVR